MEQRFAHSAPELYDRYMGPLWFEQYAEIVAERVATLQPRLLLETAAGTGIVTRAVHRAVPNAEIIATDINPGMLGFAATKLQSPNVSFRQADAQNLPFQQEEFDLVYCQFGVMFFPDRIRAYREAHRVLRPGCTFLLVTFNALEFNPIAKVIQAAVSRVFPQEPTDYMERGPFCYGDENKIEEDLHAASFMQVHVEMIDRSVRVNSKDAAYASVYGSPLKAEIERRDPSALERTAQSIEEAFQEWDGKEMAISAHLVTAK